MDTAAGPFGYVLESDMTGASRRFTTAVLTLVLIATMTMAGTLPAAATGNAPKTYRVQGQQLDNRDGTYQMLSDKGHPGLFGLWTTTSVTGFRSAPPYVFVTGTERFDGCLDTDGDNLCNNEPTGQLFFNFAFWARYDQNGNEIEGGCVHPVTSGNADFIGARGLLTMRDFLVGSVLHTTYRGTLTVRSTGATNSQAFSADRAPAPATTTATRPTGC
jgi:hypothetical protein